MARKTFEVETLKNQINHMLATSEHYDSGFRQGLALLLENVLHETGNYKGYRYLLEGQCPGRPGVNYLDGLPHPDYKKRFENTDDTRVEFH
jgi:hypothetical protein